MKLGNSSGHTSSVGFHGNRQGFRELILDTEKGLEISQLELDFPDERAFQYRIEVSNDGTQWTTVINATGNAKPAKHSNHPNPAGTKGRYVPVSFTEAAHAALVEIRVTGIVLD